MAPIHAGHVHDASCYSGGPADLLVLQMLTQERPSQSPKHRDSPLRSRRPAMDPLILQTAAASGPHVTRNHYMHGTLDPLRVETRLKLTKNTDCYPHASKYARCDEEPGPSLGTSPDFAPAPLARPTYKSLQAPRRIRLQREKANEGMLKPPSRSNSAQTGSLRRRSSAAATSDLVRNLRVASQGAATSVVSPRSQSLDGPIKVVCHARTRVPTPHGDVLLHLFKNDRDDKEHLAFVFDRPQLSESGDPDLYIRSRSLDAVWRAGETEDERIVRGAYVGRLAPQHAVASTSREMLPSSHHEPPLVRLHSECFTGETVGSQRCDCGEQLDEAFRLAATSPTGRGIVVYLRQEGRGIGLLEKLRAYNLQDLGHDTVTANLLLGHGADMRSYAVAAAILADLSVPEVRLMTNNPDKIEQLAKEGIKVAERVPMVPRTWRARATSSRAASETDESGDDSEEREAMLRKRGVGMIGASSTASPELEKYLATKAAKMGHLLDRPGVLSQAPSRENLRLAGRKVPRARMPPHSPALDDDMFASIDSLGSLECDSECECHETGASGG